MPRPPKYTPTAATALAPAPAGLFAGTSGWAYPTWKPGFYPGSVPTRAFLHHYASIFTSVEVNYTFRTLCEKEQLQGWLAATPPGFRFSFKAPQAITHFKRLRDCEESLKAFIASLKPARQAGKLGPILFQLPPTFKCDHDRLAAFLKHRSLKRDLAIAFEFRHESWFNEDTYKLLRKRNAALCVADSDDLATPDVRTATFASYRLRRNGGYTVPELKAFGEKFKALTQQGETYVYFKHEDAPTGALNAVEMLRSPNRSRPGAA